MSTPSASGTSYATRTAEAELADDLELLSLAAEHGKATFKTWVTRQLSVVVGRAVDVDSEVDVERCRELDVPIVRRASGGRSVVIGPGTVQYTFALPYYLSAELEGISSSKRFCNRLLLGGLGDSRIEQDDSGDLLLGDRKVGGLAIKRGRHAMMLHGTLLGSADIDAVASLLRHPVREPLYRRGRPHKEFLANLGRLDHERLASRVSAVLAALA